jgi:transketolase
MERRRHVAGDIVRLTSLAASGHPGGSLSTLDALLVLYACGNFDASAPDAAERDRVVVSHGHVSPAVYGVLGNFGYFDIKDVYVGFRRAGSVFGGHIESFVPGVEWNTGNLGQGLSAGAAFALSAKLHGKDWAAFVGMGDGEQQKGQISEARRFAVKYELGNLIAFVDVNGLQIGGKTDDIMPMDHAASWASDGWNVLEVDGHDLQALYRAFRAARLGKAGRADRPTVLLLRTVMGKGISFIENDHNYHGKTLSDAQVAAAFAELGLENDFDALKAFRKAGNPHTHPHTIRVDRAIRVQTGEPHTYPVSEQTDCRSAYGKALADLAVASSKAEGSWPVVAVSCDLEGSVKMDIFRKVLPSQFIEAGIAEHNAAVVTGVLSKEQIVPFYSTFGMFAVDEGYNQQRLNDQNGTAPKVVVTHCGLDVGEDGPTHQCIDYVSLMRNLYGWEVYCPADPNETDRIIRKVAGRYAPTLVAMGRSKLPTLATLEGAPALAADFVPGKWVELRPGADAVVFAFGAMVYRAVEASDALRKEGFGLRVINASSLKPFDRECIVEAAKSVGRLLTYEDHNPETGLGAIVAGVLADSGIAAKFRRLGVSRYGSSGKPDDLFAEQGLAPADVVRAARALVG